MKWLGKIADPKDVTTKEYVDSRDASIIDSTEKALSELDETKVNAKDIVEYSAIEVQSLWSRIFSAKK